jgi:hypothetical protein
VDRLLEGLLVVGLAVYFWVRGPRLAHDESLTLHRGRFERERAWSYRFGAVFLATMGIALAISAFT